jgi:GNAT superfamily N-acetyltransferase
MDKDDFKRRIIGENHIFLLAESEDKIIGFITANAKDADSPLKNRYACIVYIVVSPDHRSKGVATKLYEECVKKLKKMGITHVYAWADMKSGVITFLKKKGFNIGKPSVWVDKKL